MGQSITDRRRKVFSADDTSQRAKIRKKLDAQRRQREAQEVRARARRLAFTYNIAM